MYLCPPEVPLRGPGVSRTTEVTRVPGPASSLDRAGVSTERDRVLVDPHVNLIHPGASESGGDLLMGPPSEDLDGHRVGVSGADQLEVLSRDGVDDAVDDGMEDVEVADHAARIELGSVEHHVEPVVVRVQCPFGAVHPGHDVKGDELGGGPDVIHGSLVPESHVHHTRVTRVELLVSVRSSTERHRVGCKGSKR